MGSPSSPKLSTGGVKSSTGAPLNMICVFWPSLASWPSQATKLLMRQVASLAMRQAAASRVTFLKALCSRMALIMESRSRKWRAAWAISPVNFSRND